MDSAASPPSWLTQEYITEVLRKGEDDPKITVDNLDFNFSIGKGENYSSSIQKLHVMYHDGKGRQVKKALIIKYVPENPAMQSYSKEVGFFDKENHVYKKLIPGMASLADTPLVSAKFYPTEREDTIILEDMCSRGFRMADRKKGLNLAHSLLALKTLARFHALSYAVVKREPAILDQFPENVYSDRTRKLNSVIMPNLYKTLASIVETWPGYERFGEKILNRIDGLLDEMEELVSPRKDSFNVLNHGDFWVNNMLFRYSEDTKQPEQLCLVDLQIVRYASPALDLQYFFATSLADGIREVYEDTFLEAYHKELLATLKSLAIKSVTYTLEDLKHDFQEKAAFAFNMGCIVISAVVADPSEDIDVESPSEGSTIEDGSVNVIEKMFRGKRFRYAFQKFLLYNERRNVI